MKDGPGGVQIIDKRALAVGLGAFAIIVALACIWRLSTSSETAGRLKEFEFTVAEPVAEKFELRDPMRDIIREMPEEIPKDALVEEMPDIHVAAAPAEFAVTEAFVRSENVEIEIPEIEIEASDVDIDGPEEIVRRAEAVTYAVDVIAAKVPEPPDLFVVEDPRPREKPLLHAIDQAPQTRRVLRALPQAFGDPDASSMGKLGPAELDLSGTGEFFRIMTQFGGAKARAAVDAALAWLALHQEPDGIWSAERYEGQKGAEPAVTGLALLALMGGGHTVRKGEYRRNVLRGLEALLRLQDADGAIDKNLYSHAIGTIALCEAYGRARDERVGLAARKAIAYCERGVNPDGGWRYTANCGISDMSVTGWVIMALKTARLAQIRFDDAIYSQALSYVDSVTDRGASRDSNGVVSYQFASGQSYPSNDRPAMTAAGMMVRQFSGVGVRSSILLKGAELTMRIPPDWRNKDFYLWYYATYAMHNMGGEYRVWWNRRIRDVLLANQRQGGDEAGSWDPKGDRWAAAPGRVYTTALGALCLEVYYRYSEALTSFGVAPDLDDLFLQE